MAWNVLVCGGMREGDSIVYKSNQVALFTYYLVGILRGRTNGV